MSAHILLLGSGRLADALDRDFQTLPGVRVQRAPGLQGSTQTPTVVVDARIPAGLVDRARHGADVRAALNSGAHWVDLCRQREALLAVLECSDLAVEQGRVALSGAGPFPGLVEPFVRARLADVKRVNEVLIGFALGAGARWQGEDMAELLSGQGKPVEMWIGGERTQREFLGDRRWFEHPAPVGLRRSANVDAPDLLLYVEKPYRSASVRLSFAPPSSGAERGLRFVLWLMNKGLAKDPARHAARLARLAGGHGSGTPTSLTVCVRGIDAKNLPQERRISFQTEREAAELEVLPAAIAVRGLIGLEGPALPQAPGARHAAGLVEDLALEAFASARGIHVRRGDLGGWQKPKPAPVAAARS